MTINRWDPFRDLTTIQDRMNRLFQETLAQSRGQENLERGAWAPAVDIFETGDRIVLRADLPGLEQSDIELRVDDKTLVLKGERRVSGEVRPEDYHRSERPHGPFMRSFGLPGNVDQSGIRASHRNGVLEVILPKKQEAKAKAIRVDVK
jgi:HSP20 family protein